MDLAERKHRIIKEVVDVENESIIGDLERVLKQEKEVHQNISPADKEELTRRLEEYKKNPEDLLDWEEVKNNW